MLLLLAQETAEAVENPILPEPFEMVWAAIAFFSLWALMKYVLLPPVVRTMEEREAALRDERDAAELARASASGAAASVSDALAPARNDAAEVIEAARTEAEAERATIIASAQTEIDAMKNIAETDLAAARDEAMAGIGPKVAQLASSAASKVIERPVAVSVAQPVVDRLLNNN